MGRKAFTYAAVQGGDRQGANLRLREYAASAGLEVEEQFTDDSNAPGEASLTLFARISEDACDGCAIVVPNLRILGPSRMIRAILAAYRELDIPIYLADHALVIDWAGDPRAGRIPALLAYHDELERTA